MKKELTVIIPFLNENNEVLNTVKNIRENSDQDFDIILINDCSTDGYNYKKVAEDYGALYIEHSQRIGVAASRDEAIDLCNTEYFLLLDAHMRVYQRNWVDIFVAELKKNPKDLLCALTLALDSNGKPTTRKLGYGAYLNIIGLGVNWLHRKDVPFHKKDILIPCVLGASYACSKRYWQYLEGLQGLKSYGLDEQLISIKVWLDGGRCRLIKSIKFGHVFRDAETVPYELRPKDFCRNVLLIAELFYGFEMKVQLLQDFRAHRNLDFVSEVIEELSKEKESILSRKKHYKSIFSNTIDHFIAINDMFKNKAHNNKSIN